MLVEYDLDFDRPLVRLLLQKALCGRVIAYGFWCSLGPLWTCACLRELPSDLFGRDVTQVCWGEEYVNMKCFYESFVTLEFGNLIQMPIAKVTMALYLSPSYLYRDFFVIVTLLFKI